MIIIEDNNNGIELIESGMGSFVGDGFSYGYGDGMCDHQGFDFCCGASHGDGDRHGNGNGYFYNDINRLNQCL